MKSLTHYPEAQTLIAGNSRQLRLNMELTQAGLAKRAGVSLPSLKKFEQKGIISFESFLKLQLALGNLDRLIKATQPQTSNFNSIKDVVKANATPKRQRGWRE